MCEYVCVITDNMTFRPVQEVVRCRDCFFYDESTNTCSQFIEEVGNIPSPVDPDGFCAWGEGKERDE